MTIGIKNSLLLLSFSASLSLAPTALGDNAAPQDLDFEYDVVCAFSSQSAPPPTSVAAINDLVGSSFSCDGSFMSTGLFEDDGEATQQEILLGSSQSPHCGMVFSRNTFHGSGGDIFVDENNILFCPPGSFGLFGTFKTSYVITGGTGSYVNLIGRGKSTGTFAIDLSIPAIVVHSELQGKASFVN